MVGGALLGGALGGAGINIIIRAIDKFSGTFNKAGMQMQGLTGFAQKYRRALFEPLSVLLV